MGGLWLLLGLYFIVIYILTLRIFYAENHTFAKATTFAGRTLKNRFKKTAVNAIVTDEANTV
jgi:hypothetical protein